MTDHTWKVETALFVESKYLEQGFSTKTIEPKLWKYVSLLTFQVMIYSLWKLRKWIGCRLRAKNRRTQ